MTDQPLGPVDASLTPRYASIATFAKLPRIEEVPSADIATVGVPFDSGVSFRPGARFGPAHVRKASRLLRPYNPAPDASPFALKQIVDAGDISANPFNIDEAVRAVEEAATELGTWDTYFSAPTTHGTPFRRASEEGLIDLTASMHGGTRGPLYGKQDLVDDESLGFQIVTSEFIEERGVPRRARAHPRGQVPGSGCSYCCQAVFGVVRRASAAFALASS